MLKIMRKNKQWMFVAFMGILAVAWLVPGLGGQQSPEDALKEKVGMIGDQKITLGDINKAELEYESLKSQFQGLISLEMLVGVPVENGTHWLLLCREADQGGLIGGPTDGADWIPALAKAMAPEQARSMAQTNVMEALQMVQSDPKAKEIIDKNPQMIMPILTQMVEQRLGIMLERVKESGNQRLRGAQALGTNYQNDPFDHIIAKVRGVRRLTNSFYGAARSSDKRLQSIAVDRLDQAIVDYVMIPADRLKREIPDPTPEQLQAHFDKFKAVMPGSPELGVGYVQPDGIKLEFLKLDRAAIESSIKADEVEVNKRWRTNREKYKGEFSEERPRIESEMKADMVKNAMAEAVRIARAEVTRATKRLSDDGAYKVLPADWETSRIKLEDIARVVQSTIKNTQNIDIPLPLVTIKSGTWLSPRDVSSLEGLSRASTQIGLKRESFVQLVGHLKEASGRNDYALQIGIPYPNDKALEGPDGSMYFFTILGYKKSAPAETLDEVRTQAIDDFKLIGAYEKLKAEQQKYLDRAVAEGVEGIARSFERPPLDAKTGAGGEAGLPVVRLAQVDATRVLADGRNEKMLEIKEYVDQVRAIARTLDPKAPPALGDAAKGEAVKNRFAAYPLPQAKSLVLSFVVASRPVTQELMRAVGQSGQERSLVLQEFRPEEGKAKVEDPFLLVTMKQRMRFVLTKELKVEEKPVKAQEPAPATGDAPKPAPASDDKK